uniref:Inositol polyphosphate-related phosphatase domain-containing protein n=1 Tax=Ananas comosus var. bracteatus TaxID=296719 RepID=A0A6V7NP16_ANACO|nr:unnamed protein product [Ananas comosus var. bracteatus]
MTVMEDGGDPMGAALRVRDACTVGLEGSPNGQWWLDSIGNVLNGASFERVGSRQLAGLLIAVWARRNLKQYIGDIDSAAVPCGFGRAIGNKGAVGLRMRIYDRNICFVNCHFAAHMEAVDRRNEDFEHVFRTMTFNSLSSGLLAAAGCTSVQLNRAANATNNRKPELSEADMVVFLGDFNYRLHDVSYEEAMELISRRRFDRLREKDQLRAEMKAGRVFQGLREAQIDFPPTYKFERNQAGLSGYDSSDKKRIPAWCDRILYRDNQSVSGAQCSLECPVVSSISMYKACIDVNDSDHKPVKSVFSVDIAHTNEITRRQEFGKIISSNKKVRSSFEELQVIPESAVSISNIILQNQDISIIRITNKSMTSTAGFEIMCEDLSTAIEDERVLKSRERGSTGFPNWLKVAPAIGIIYPEQTVEVSVQHVDPQSRQLYDRVSWNRWSEGTPEKIATLILQITGCYSTETKSYRVNVRHRSSRSMAHTSKKLTPSERRQKGADIWFSSSWSP